MNTEKELLSKQSTHSLEEGCTVVVIRHMKIIRHASINDDHQRDFVRANDEMGLKCQYILAFNDWRGPFCQ